MSRAAGAAGAMGALMAAGLTGCAAAPTDAVDYRDGTYEATGWYGSLPSHQDLTLTIEDDRVTEVAITAPAEDPTSLEHQQRFAAALGDEIIGRDIDSIALDRLAGASGCSEGFMNALAEIKDSARA
ncbi:hypothetical protein [Microbacterium sp. NPDC087868]|uniref:hypothetical protein n=1 Tax=Microbacterium sp. NPDC087868 TaxID=3364195 RepID=UPI00384DBD1C